MRRLIRIMLIVATMLALALWPFTLVLWLNRFHVLKTSPDGLSETYNFRGSISVRQRSRQGPDTVDRWGTWRTWRFLGFGVETHTRADGSTVTTRTFHVWPVTVLNIVLIGNWLLPPLRARRSAQRRKRQLCPACGYDCRATPDRCPECGRATGDETSR